MCMIRATTQVIRAIRKHKDEFPILFNDYETQKKKIEDERKKMEINYHLKNDWMIISDEAREEYLRLVENYLKVKKFPNSNRKVVITTHNGGKYVGFYEDGKWWYNTAENRKIEETGIVIKWEKNYF